MRTNRTAALALLAILTGALAFPGEPPAKPEQPNKAHKEKHPDPKPAPEPPKPAPAACGTCWGIGKTPLGGDLWRVCPGCLGTKIAPVLPTQEARDAFLGRRANENAAVDAYASALSIQGAADASTNQRTTDGRRFSLTPASVARKQKAAAAAWAKVQEWEAKVGHPIAAPDPAAAAELARRQEASKAKDAPAK